MCLVIKAVYNKDKKTKVFEVQKHLEQIIKLIKATECNQCKITQLAEVIKNKVIQIY